MPIERGRQHELLRRSLRPGEHDRRHRLLMVCQAVQETTPSKNVPHAELRPPGRHQERACPGGHTSRFSLTRPGRARTSTKHAAFSRHLLGRKPVTRSARRDSASSPPWSCACPTACSSDHTWTGHSAAIARGLQQHRPSAPRASPTQRHMRCGPRAVKPTHPPVAQTSALAGFIAAALT